jgi:AcrR family transcriptional regulator
MPIELAIPEQLRPPRLGPSSAELTDRGRAILDALGDIFLDEGFMHLTIGDLAERLHCSRRTLYALAPNRSELVLIVLDRRLRRIGRKAGEYLRTIDDPMELLKKFMLAGQSEIHQATAQYAEDTARTPAVERLNADHFRYHTAILGAILEHGIAEGTFRPVNTRLVAETVDAAFNRFRDPSFRREVGLNFEEANALLVDLLRFGLQVASDPDAGGDVRGPSGRRSAASKGRPVRKAAGSPAAKRSGARARPI